MPNRDSDAQKNRDDEMRPGAPPRPASHPEGSEGSTRTDKTLTDPATGAPEGGAPAPSQSTHDETPGRRT